MLGCAAEVNAMEPSDLYLNEADVTKTDGFAPLQANLAGFANDLAGAARCFKVAC